MPNKVQFTGTTPTISSLKHMNFFLGVQSQSYGPTSNTGFWNGITVPSGGYVLYLNKATQGPSIYVLNNEETGYELLKLALPQPVFIPDFYNYVLGVWGNLGTNDSILLNRDYENVRTNDAYIFIDPSFYMCNLYSAGTPSTIKNITTPNLIESNNNLNNSATISSDNDTILSFDGVNDQFLILDFGLFNTHLKFTGDVTYEFFIKLKDLTGSTSQIYYKSDLNEGVISANTSNKLVYSYGNGSNSQIFESTSALTNSTWYHIVLVRDFNDTGKLYWYLNGVEDSNVSTTYSSASSSNNSTYFFTNGTSDWTLVDVGVIRVYNAALSASEVLQNFNAQKSRFGL